MRPMIYSKLSTQEQFQLLEVFRNRPMRQSACKAACVPSIRERVADKKIPVFLLFLPLREVSGISDSLTNFLSDMQKKRLPRKPPAFVGVPYIMTFLLQFIIDNIFGKVLNVS